MRDTTGNIVVPDEAQIVLDEDVINAAIEKHCMAIRARTRPLECFFIASPMLSGSMTSRQAPRRDHRWPFV